MGPIHPLWANRGLFWGSDLTSAPQTNGSFGVGQDESTSEGTGTLSEEVSEFDQAAQADASKPAHAEVGAMVQAL